MLQVLPSDMIILAEPVPARMVAAIARAIELLPQIDPFDMHRRVCVSRDVICAVLILTEKCL